MKLRLAFALLLALVVTAPATTQAERLASGTFEWSIGGDFSRSSFDFDGTETGDRTEMSLSTELGYFITEVFQVAVGVSGTRYLDQPQDPVFILPERDANAVGFGARVIVNVPNGSRMTPYAYLGAATISYSGDEELVGGESSTVLPSGGLGARYFLGDHISFNMEFDFSHINNRNGFKDENADRLSFRLGFSAFLNRE